MIHQAIEAGTATALLLTVGYLWNVIGERISK